MLHDTETLRRAREEFDVHAEPIAHLLRADDITDIVLNVPQHHNEPGPVWVDRVGVGLEDSGVRLDAARADLLIRDFASQATGVVLNEQCPRMSCQAALGQYRIEATISPASPSPAFTLRKYVRRGDVTFADYVRAGEMSESAASGLAFAAEHDEKTILVGGQTGCGKTTLLHPILHAAARGGARRLILIEDTPELELPDGPNTRLKVDPESAFTYREAVKSALRQRPDTIVLGEVRDGDAAMQTVEAWNTGHQGIGTLHAGSCQEMLWRLFSLCRQSESGRHVQHRAIASAVQICVHLRRINGRRVIDVRRVVRWNDSLGEFELEAL